MIARLHDLPLFALTVGLALLPGCKPATAKDKYRDELYEKMDVLVDALRKFGPDTVTVPSRMTGPDGRVATGETKVSRAWVVANAAEAVVDHLGSMNLMALAEIRQAVKSDPAWTAEFQKGFAKRLAQANEGVKRAYWLVKVAPSAYRTSPSVMGMSLGDTYAYDSVRFDGDDVVFMTSDSRGMNVSEVLRLDLSRWLAAVAETGPR